MSKIIRVFTSPVVFGDCDGKVCLLMAQVITSTECIHGLCNDYVMLYNRRLVPEAESFEDHLRVMIRYACSMLLRRAQHLDVPHLIMHKFLPVAAAHIHIYMKARSKCKSLSLSLPPFPFLPLLHIHKHSHVTTMLV